MSTSHDRPFAVLGATGQQGGAVVDALLTAGAPVRAVVRDAGSAASTALADRGVEVVEGDQNEPDSMVGPLSGIAAAFLMFTFTDSTGPAGEIRRGTAVGDAAVRAGVPRVVYSSVGGAERHTGIPHFDSKRRIEEHLQSVLPTVVVRPAYFMDNLTQQVDQSDAEFVLRMPMPGDVPLQMISTYDIGRVCAAALLDETALGGAALEIASDQLTPQQMAATIGRRLDRPARYEELPLDSLGDNDDLKAMFRWFVDTRAYQADIEQTERVAPGLLDLAAWLARRPDAG